MNDDADEQPDGDQSQSSSCSGTSVRLYQIGSDELADLERLVPQLFTMLGEAMNHVHVRRKIQRVKNILSDIRWEGLPWSRVEKIEPE